MVRENCKSMRNGLSVCRSVGRTVVSFCRPRDDNEQQRRMAAAAVSVSLRGGKSCYLFANGLHSKRRHRRTASPSRPAHASAKAHALTLRTLSNRILMSLCARNAFETLLICFLARGGFHDHPLLSSALGKHPHGHTHIGVDVVAGYVYTSTACGRSQGCRLLS